MKKLGFENLVGKFARRGGGWSRWIHRNSFKLIAVCLMAGIASTAIAQTTPQRRRTSGASDVRVEIATRPLVTLLPPVASQNDRTPEL
ncbi:MAG: hypothetical protein HON53_22265 [Planctomycetaceae bacterium]|nr:hypothetical protein [Planctomycetaceae bacterium]